jgi:hypothetical protein
MAGAPKGNKNNEKYTLQGTIKLFESALYILKGDTSIITETELIVRCKYELSLPFSSYEYLRDKKFPIELGDIIKEINSLLEIRVMRTKDMFPGIAAMTLKNKHRWKDQQNVAVEQKIKHEASEELLDTIAELLS